MRSIHPSSRQAGDLDTLHIWCGYEAQSWWIKCAASQMLCLVQWHLLYCLYGDGERDTKVNVGAQQSCASHRGQHRCVTVSSGTIKLHSMWYLHYCGSISMSWRSVLLIQMAEECVRIGKHGKIIDHLNLYSFKCSHHEYEDDLDLWRLGIFCIWRRKTHQSHTWQLISYSIITYYDIKLDHF